MHVSESATLAVIMFFVATMAVATTPDYIVSPPQTTVALEQSMYSDLPKVPNSSSDVTATTSPFVPIVASTKMTAAVTNATKKPAQSKTKAPVATSTEGAMVVEKPRNLYSTDPLSIETVNMLARGALVNIYCAPTSLGLSPVTGSGVLLSSDGIILTNAHVAQYVFLAQIGIADIQCSARTGSPAITIGNLQTIYLPPLWVAKNAKLIQTEKPMGTGERDFALIALSVSPASPLPFVIPETREKAAFEDDQVLLASYPAEFLGSLVTQSDLYSVSSVTRVTKMLTFAGKTVDAFALGSVIGAQGGSSGGAVVNGWSRLVGLITTTSAGATTAERELHAISLYHVNSELVKETGKTLADWVQNARVYGKNFLVTSGLPLLQEYEKVIR